MLNEIHCLFPNGVALGLYLSITINGDCSGEGICLDRTSAFLMLATNPAKQMIRMKFSQFFNGSPATLAGVRSGSLLLHQLCFQFVKVWHAVPEKQIIT